MFTDDIMLPRGTTIDLNRLQGSVLQTKSKSQLPKKIKVSGCGFPFEAEDSIRLS